VTAAINGKGNESTVTMLERIAEKLRETPFTLLAYAPMAILASILSMMVFKMHGRSSFLLGG
jgi:hypothetical protein